MNIITIPVSMRGTNCYIFSNKAGDCVVVDPGAQGDKIADKIAEEKLKLRYILVTHGHHDHIGGLKKLMAAIPEAKAMIGENDMELLSDPNKSFAARHYSNVDEYIIENVEPLSDGSELFLDELKIHVMETPGHTMGGVCYICGDTIFSGDTLFFEDVGRCDLLGSDYSAMKASLRKLCALNGNYRVYPGHGRDTSLDYERKNNPYIAEAMNEA